MEKHHSTDESEENLELKVLSWLRKQGYPLEMKAALAFKKATQSFVVTPGWHYEDPNNNIYREIDLICTKNEPYGLAEIHFAIECKGTSKPWIIFSSSDANNLNRLSAFSVMSRGARDVIAKKLFKLGIDADTEFEHARSIPWFWKEGRVGYAITQAFDGNSDTPYAACISAIKSALFLKKASPLQSTEYRQFMLAFPVVITSSPLFECYLEENGELVLKEIETSFLFFTQPISDVPGTSIRIVNEKALQSFVSECSELSESVMQLLKPSIEETWNNFLASQKNVDP